MGNDLHEQELHEWKSRIATMILIKREIWTLDVRHMWPHALSAVAASEYALSLTEQSVGPLDRAYRLFLECADGWRGFYQWVDLFGTNELIGSASVQVLGSLADRSLDAELARFSLEVKDLLPIAASQKDTDVFLMVRREHRLAGQVLWVAGGVVDKFATFTEFFLAVADYNREEIKDLLGEQRSNH